MTQPDPAPTHRTTGDPRAVDVPAALAQATAVTIAGDWHGASAAARDVIEVSADQGIHVILHLGDFGIGPWGDHSRSMTNLVDAALHKFRSILLVTPGNHENWDRIDAAPRRPDGLITLGRRLFALPRGHRFTVGGRKFGSLGGAVSIDRAWLTPGSSWWPQEVPTMDHVRRLGSDPLDVLLMHDVPEGVRVVSTVNFAIDEDILLEADDVRMLLAMAVTATKPRLTFSGHWHQRRTQDVTHADGTLTTAHVLAHEFRAGNAVTLDLASLEVAPLPLLAAFN